MASKKTPQRHLNYDAAARRLRIATDRVTETYTVTAFRDEEDGRIIGLRMAKQGGDEAVYDIEIAEARCECLGFLRWGHCKHEAAARKLIECRLIKA
jgi:hypothetical protein